MNFEVVQNDITNMSVDAIVLPANEELKEGRGTSHAIFVKAGRKSLKKACQDIAPCKVGDAVPTLAFNLDSNYIIHAVVPKWIDGNHQEYDYLSATYLSALKVADVMECNSIAFPLLASGNNGFDLNLAYEIAKTTIESFTGSNQQRIALVVYGDNIATFFKGKGIHIVNLQVESDLAKAKHQALRKQRFKASTKLATTILEEQLAKSVEYLKDEENRKKVIETGIAIAKFVIQLKAATKTPPTTPPSK